MGYSMGYTIPLIPWDGTGIGWRGGHTILLRRYGITYKLSSKLSLFWLAYYSNRLSLLLVSHNIPYLLAWDWYGIWEADSILFYGMGADPYILYHPISFRPLVLIPGTDVA